MRQASVERNTSETRISATVNLDGSGRYDVATGIGFLDHMLEQLSRHSLIDIALKAEGDLHIDLHHTTEDTGIVLGQAVARALGARKGIVRFAEAFIPMDETLTRVALDVSNPGLPTPLAIDDIGSTPIALHLDGTQLVVGYEPPAAGDFRGIRVMDVSDPAAPVEIASLPTNFDPQSVTRFGSVALVAIGNQGVRAIDLVAPAVYDADDPGGNVLGVTADGSLFAVAAGARLLVLYGACP